MDKKVTSRDVAKAAGVSQSLVSLILNNVAHKKIKPETRAHVIEVAKQLNYTVNINARNMKNRKAGAIGLLSAWDTNSFVFPPVINGIQHICSQNDIGVLVCTGKEDISGTPDYINYYLQNRIDALIYISFVGVTYDGVISRLTEAGVPFVCIIGARDIPGVSCVDVSFIESGYMAGKHLIEQGYKRIGYIAGAEEKNMNYAENERVSGVRRAAEGKEFLLIDSFMGIEDEKDFLKKAHELLKENKYDAFVSTSYNCFIILKAAAAMGIKVPERVGVISLDNEVYAPYLYPSLTTIDEPLFDIAKNAMDILFEKIHGDRVCRKLEIAPNLSVRDSTRRT